VLINPGYHVAAYYGAVPTGTSAYTAIAGVQDGQLTRSASNNFLLPQPAKVELAAVYGTNMLRSRLIVPSLRDMGRPHIGPVDASSSTPTVQNIYDPGIRPLPTTTGEEVGIEGMTSDAGSVNVTGVLFFRFNDAPAPIGPCYRLRGTATCAGAVGSWYSSQITLEDTLPPGEFAIIGMDVVGANLGPARLIFPQGGFRPGCLTRDDVADVRLDNWSFGRFGALGSFKNFALPMLECFARGAIATQDVFLDLIRIGPG
jgi:hypothetical protein